VPEQRLKVTLLEHTPDPEGLVAVAARSCYARSSAAELKEKLKPEQREKLLKLLLNGGHHSPVEHASFTFVIEGISRSCSHQLVRHRLASYSQQSQRYVGANNFGYIIPPSIIRNQELKELFIKEMEKISQSYQFMVEKLKEIGRSAEQAQEDARFLLPNAAETKITMTMNARELIQAANLRLCLRAQWEIRKLFSTLKKEVSKVSPTFASYMVPKCDPHILGYCPEGKLACHWVERGLVRLKEDVVGTT